MARSRPTIAPSMRNGTHRSDRGNAILSTLPLTDAVATELPLARQRRVAVSASIRAGGRVVRLHSAHLDPRGRGTRDILGTAGRLLQIRGLIDSLDVDDGVPHILGADLNLARQRREPAFRALAEAGFATGVPPRVPAWRHTYHRVPRLILDWLLVLDRDATIAGAVVRRLDEHPLDRGPTVFGSDHHPLLARIDLAP
jgi:endonuclease/exonuclease/phosphatase family metal-dependent hydrolase